MQLGAMRIDRIGAGGALQRGVVDAEPPALAQSPAQSRASRQRSALEKSTIPAPTLPNRSARSRTVTSHPRAVTPRPPSTRLARRRPRWLFAPRTPSPLLLLP